MDFELQAASPEGQAFVALCEGHEQDFSDRAAKHDSDGSFPLENTADMIASGVTRATVPVELGGIGVTSLRDFTVGISRLGRGDASIALAMNMHLFIAWRVARAWRAARSAGDAALEATHAKFLRDVAAGRSIVAVVVTEPGAAAFIHPEAEAVRDGDGWRLNGRKSFATGSPAANFLAVRFRIKDAAGNDRVASAMIPTDASGVENRFNWDALGMRASGSHDIVFNNCFLPAADVVDAGPWGTMTTGAMLSASFAANGLTAAFLGIAETARAIALRQTVARKRAGRPGVQHLVAGMEIDLAAARAMLERAAVNTDRVLAGDPTDDDLRSAMKDVQATKHFVMRKAIEIVDHAMTCSGGAGYMSANPLSRLYRDVRAGPFMQPFGPVEGFEVIGKITLAQEL